MTDFIHITTKHFVVNKLHIGYIFYFIVDVWFRENIYTVLIA